MILEVNSAKPSDFRSLTCHSFFIDFPLLVFLVFLVLQWEQEQYW